MEPSSRTPEGEPNRCPICGHVVAIEPSRPPGDAPCPHCGHLLWFAGASFENAAPYENLEFISSDAVIQRLEVPNKLSAITVLANRLHSTGKLPQEALESVITAMVRREELGSTGIGGGLAIPHTKHPSISTVVGAVGYSHRGIDFGSLDGQLVHTVVLLLSSPDKPGEYLKALERIAKIHRRSR
jgi:PTS system fructose-specific IIA component/PTS system nitrogen regulatory IIA component